MKPLSFVSTLTAVALCLAVPGVVLAQQSSDPQATQPGVSDQEAATGTSDDGNIRATPQAGEEESATEEESAAGEEESVTGEEATLDAASLVGQQLYGAEDEAYGEISSVVEADGKVQAVVVDIGQFLGMGSKMVEIPADQISVEGDRVNTQLTRADLETLPASEGTEVKPGNGGAAEGAEGAEGEGGSE